jgi:ABC-2 type transport system ATP-binding protein
MNSGGPAISVHNLVKHFGSRTAVAGISFDVECGEIFALLGPNGAGKTTTVEMLEGYQRPDRGEVRVLGLDPITQGGALKQEIGAMPQEGGLYPAITPREALHLFSHFYSRPGDPDALLARVGLEDRAGARYRRLSGGEKQRLSLALALVGSPRLVFLDEPTAGLDPQGRRTTWEIIEALRERQVTVLLTTHYLEEAERLADRVAILNHGELVAIGTPASLMTGNRSQVRLRAARPIDETILEALPTVSAMRREGAEAWVFDTADPPVLLVELTGRFYRAGVPIVELRVGQASLEEVYLELTEAVL